MRLRDKTAIITGAGAGIGRATAVRFAEEGANLLLADINDAEIRAAAEEVAALGVQVATVTGDISNEDIARQISETAFAKFGGIDIVVNNAANFTTAPIETATVEQWRKVLDINVVGTALVSKYAIPHLKKSGKGSIVNISSTSAIMAQPNFATYNTSKGALLSMTICSALDLAPFNIRVNSVCPGCVYTTASEREWTRMGQTREEWSAEMAKQHMLGRVGEAREVANAILFFASDEASFITGAHLMVDGGRTAQ
jgi:NAD(P)-dependent dehydrogenase (short-subunit alcohol dehydrogenase family)